MPTIKALAEKDPTFCGILVDYEELCIWLAKLTRNNLPDDREIELARELISDLEEEIASHLKRHVTDASDDENAR